MRWFSRTLAGNCLSAHSMKDSSSVPRRPKRRSRFWNLTLAVFFFILGVIGVLIPVMPQIPFFVMSLLFFSLVFPGVRRAMRRFLHRHPRVAHAYKRWRERARRRRLEVIRREKERAAKPGLRREEG